MKYHGPMLVF